MLVYVQFQFLHYLSNSIYCPHAVSTLPGINCEQMHHFVFVGFALVKLKRSKSKLIVYIRYCQLSAFSIIKNKCLLWIRLRVQSIRVHSASVYLVWTVGLPLSLCPGSLGTISALWSEQKMRSRPVMTSWRVSKSELGWSDSTPSSSVSGATSGSQ